LAMLVLNGGSGEGFEDEVESACYSGLGSQDCTGDTRGWEGRENVGRACCEVAQDPALVSKLYSGLVERRKGSQAQKS
jgi:hypothetical protein